MLRLAGLSKAYGGTPAVRGVDLDVAERSFVTLLGPSGCGKTTLLRMVGGFERPDGGSILLDGVDVTALPPERRPVNTVFQSYALFPHLDVAANVGFSLSVRSLPVEVVRQRVHRALAGVQMEGFAARMPHELSGGQQQRVAVARAIVAEPRLLLLDEPLSALDRKMRLHLQTELKDLQRRLGIGFLYVTHDQDEAFALSDEVVVMQAGRIAQRGAPDALYHRPGTAWVADFIGGAALLPGRVTEASGGRASLDTRIGRIAAPAHPGLRPGAAAVLCVRPEHVGPAAASSCIVVEAQVAGATFHAGRTLLRLRCGPDGGTTLQSWSATPTPIGTRLRVALDPDRIWAAQA